MQLLRSTCLACSSLSRVGKCALAAKILVGKQPAVEPARVLSPHPAAGSENPASSVSSGGVEAEREHTSLPTVASYWKWKSFPASARVGWKLKSRLSSPLEKAEGKTNDIARSGTTMRATSKAGAMCLVVAVANMLGPGTSTTPVWFLKVRRCCRTVSGGSAISLLASERARSYCTLS